MKIKSLSIKNFLTLKEAELRLDGRGLLLIQGDNRDDTSADSNGAGKSSVVDAISWALYGVTARGVTGDAVVNLAAAKGAQVMVELEDGPNTYFIRRGRKPNALDVLAGDGASLSKGTEKETQELINKIIGCSLEVFLAAVYAGQEAMPDLPGMTDKQLKVLIEEAAGIEVLDAAYKVARAKHSVAALELSNRLGEQKALTNAGAAFASDLTVIERDEAAFADTMKKAEQDYIDAARLKGANAKAVKDELEKLDEAAVRASLADKQTKLAALADEQSKLNLLQKALNEANAGLVRALSQVDQGKRALADKERALQTIGARVGTPCKECGKEYHTHDLADATDLAQKAVEAAKAELLKAAQAAKVAKNTYDGAQLALSDFRATMTDPTELTKAMMEDKDKLAAIEASKRLVQTLVKEAQDHLTQAKGCKEGKNPYTDQVERVKKKIAENEESLKKADEAVEKAKQALAIAEDAVKVFGPAGVRAHILDTVTPFLNDRTSEYLGALSDGAITAVWSTLGTTAKGELREKFNIEVKHSKGGDSFASLSGGEKRKVRLACFMALQDMVATRASKPIDLFIADEIDQALDESGLERLMGVLETKARERGTVLVISHHSLSDWIDNVITVVKEGGTSRVEGAVA
jgi:DNA repair exonuclease SbcCD ATPase subunit